MQLYRAGYVLAGALLFGIAPFHAAGQSRRIELGDFAKIVSVADPQIAPDGRAVVCVVSRVNLEQDRDDKELVLVDVATGGMRSLTRDRKDLRSLSPECGSSCFVNTIELPSGDHEIGDDGELGGKTLGSVHVPEVSRRGFPPSAATSQMCEGVGALDSR